jgi:hypothetical protein
MKNLLTCTLVIVLAYASGCGLGTQDPLLFDDDDMIRTSVNIDEVEAAGIPSCIDVEGFDASESDIVVPVEGGDGETVLIGIGGQALCLGEGGDGDPGNVDDIGDEVKPDEDHPVELDGDDSGDESGDDDSDVALHTRDDQPADGQGLGNTQRPMVLWDPTPEPATN